MFHLTWHDLKHYSSTRRSEEPFQMNHYLRLPAPQPYKEDHVFLPYIMIYMINFIMTYVYWNMILHYKTNCFNINITHVISFLNLIGWGSCEHWKSSPQKVAVVNYFIIYWNNGIDTSCHSSPHCNEYCSAYAGDVIFMMSWFIKGDMSCLNCSFLHSRMTEIPQVQVYYDQVSRERSYYTS